MSAPEDQLQNPPQWLANAVRGIQGQLDNQYATAKAVYAGAVQNWISQNVQNRDTGKALTSFTAAKPVHWLAYAAAGDSAANALGQVKQYADLQVDSSLPEPVLPAPLKAAPSLGGIGQMMTALVNEGGAGAGGAGGGASSDTLAQILTALSQITATLAQHTQIFKSMGVI